MTGFDERAARWVVQGVASGEPMRVGTALDALNELLALDPEGVSSNLFGKPLAVINDILSWDDPCGSGLTLDEQQKLVPKALGS